MEWNDEERGGVAGKDRTRLEERMHKKLRKLRDKGYYTSTLAWILENMSRKQIKKAIKRAMRTGQYYIVIQLESALARKALNPHH